MAGSILSIIKKRRSTRHFIQKEVDDSILLELVEAAIWAPTGGNIQMWYFVIVKGKGVLERVKAFSPGLMGDPSCLVVVCSDRKKAFERAGKLGRDESCVMDTSMAAQNLMLMAAEKGLGTCPIGSFNKKAVGKILELPGYISPDLIISIGYPAKDVKPPKRKDVEEVTFINKWGVGINGQE